MPDQLFDSRFNARDILGDETDPTILTTDPTPTAAAEPEPVAAQGPAATAPVAEPPDMAATASHATVQPLDSDGALGLATSGRTTFDGVPLTQILIDRPDVYAAFYSEYYGPNNDHHSSAWVDRVGGVTPEDYANYWYASSGKAGGYVPSTGVPVVAAAAPVEPVVRMTSDGIPLSQILHDRPDVFGQFYTDYYGANNDHHSSAWVDRVGGVTPEDYANYWYESSGKAGGYVPSGGVASSVSSGRASPLEAGSDSGFTFTDTGRTTVDGVKISQIFQDRPDVYRSFFTEYYGPNNDHHSSAWVDRVGGTTPEDYANYWYNSIGKIRGYVPSTHAAPANPEPSPSQPAPDAAPSDTITAPDPTPDAVPDADPAPAAGASGSGDEVAATVPDTAAPPMPDLAATEPAPPAGPVHLSPEILALLDPATRMAVEDAYAHPAPALDPFGLM